MRSRFLFPAGRVDLEVFKITRFADFFRSEYWRSLTRAASPTLLFATRDSLLLITPRKSSLLLHLFTLELAALVWVGILMLVGFWYPVPRSPGLIASIFVSFFVWIILFHRWTSIIASRNPRDARPVHVLDVGKGRFAVQLRVKVDGEEAILLVRGFRSSIVAALKLAGEG
jgi:hypothetical protein